MGGWKRIGGGGNKVDRFWDFKEAGDEIKGAYMGFFETPARNQFPAQKVIILLTKADVDPIVGVNVKAATKCVLELEHGAGVYIRYLGRKKLKEGSWFHNFDVRTWDPDAEGDDAELEVENKHTSVSDTPPSWGDGEGPESLGESSGAATDSATAGDPGADWE